MKRLVNVSVLMIVSLLTLVGCKQGLNSESYEATGDVKTIEITEIIGNVKIEKTTDEHVSVTYSEITGAYDVAVNYREEDETLVIRRKDSRTSFQKGEFKSESYIKVYIPEKDVPDLNVSVNTGNATFSKGEYGNITINVTLGNISIDESNAKVVELETNNGNISCDKLNCERISYKNTHKGNTEFNGVKAEEAIEGDINYGDVSFDVVSSRLLTLKAQNANADLRGVEVTERMSVNIVTGNIDVSLKGRKTDYSLVAKSGTDTASNINTGTGDVSVNLNTTVGKIAIEYSR